MEVEAPRQTSDDEQEEVPGFETRYAQSRARFIQLREGSNVESSKFEVCVGEAGFTPEVEVHANLSQTA
jgi:hypothetical protein